MSFEEWRGSDKYDATQYRWYITSCSIKNRELAELATKGYTFCRRFFI